MKKKTGKTSQNAKTRKTQTSYSAMEKCRAVLAIWTERRTMSEMCNELSVNWAQLNNWQNKALEGMLVALETRRKEEKKPELNVRLQKLLAKKKPANAPRKLEVTLEKRLNGIRKETDSS